MNNIGEKNLFRLARECLLEHDLEKKIRCSREIVRLFHAGELQITGDDCPVADIEPGRPGKPELVPARALPKRSFATDRGRAAMLHALAHIEFNAINIAWDAIQRFRNLPADYYRDWLKIAGEETHHFCLLRTLLQERGYDYGAFDAHDGLWRAVERTADDVLARMAIVPRVYEARGLDVTPDIINRFREIGEKQICDVLDIIYADEIGHVAVGNHWFRYICEQRGLVPFATFMDLLKQHMDSVPRMRLNREARLAAGFSREELDYMEREFTS